MKKFLLFTLAAVMFAACGDDGTDGGGGNGGGKTGPKYTITLAKDAKAYVAGKEVTSAYEGDVVQLVAAPLLDNNFVRWQVNSENATVLLNKFIMPAQGVDVEPVYDVDTYSVNTGSNPNIKVYVNEDTTPKTFAPVGATVKLVWAATDTGYAWNSWVCEDEEIAAQLANETTTTFIMPARAVTVTADETKESYALTVEGGTATHTGNVAVGTVVTLTYSPTAVPVNYAFDRWTSSEVGTFTVVTDSDPVKYTFVMPGKPATVTATYKKLTTYAITVTGGGSSLKEAAAGVMVPLTPGPAPTGKLFGGWKSNVDTVAFNGNTFKMPARAISVNAVYVDPAKFDLTVTNGKPSISGQVEVGTKVTLTPDAAPEGQLFRGWNVTAGGITVASDNTFTMPFDPVTIEAKYSDIGKILLYLDGDGKLALGEWGHTVSYSNMLGTQWGSVIGLEMSSANEATNKVFNSASVKFNPTDIDPTTWNGDWGGIPHMYTKELSDVGTPYVTNNHNGANVKAGKGDICRLVGLSAADIKGMSESELDVYDSGYRLPKATAIGTANGGTVTTTELMVIYNGKSESVTVNSAAGIRLKGGDNSTFMPKCGQRYNGYWMSTYWYYQPGYITNVNSYGYYWTSSPHDIGERASAGLLNGADLTLATGTFKNTNATGGKPSGYAVRCVPN